MIEKRGVIDENTPDEDSEVNISSPRIKKANKSKDIEKLEAHVTKRLADKVEDKINGNKNNQDAA